MLDLTLDEAMQRVSAVESSCLLGNGFSIAYSSRFRYDSLLSLAEPGLGAKARTLFRMRDTTDFEEVIGMLTDAAIVADAYGEGLFQAYFETEAEGVRKALVDAIQQSHPVNASHLSEAAKWSCGAFLSMFRAIYTTNYDLLMYWVINATPPPGQLRLTERFKDGFGRDGAGPLVWSGGAAQNTTYLHGALHFVADGLAVKKLEWQPNLSNLLGEIRKVLDDGQSPLFVTEGNSSRKLRKIREHLYLEQALQKMAEDDGLLLTLGFSRVVG